jgi:hypothetical protein
MTIISTQMLPERFKVPASCHGSSSEQAVHAEHAGLSDRYKHYCRGHGPWLSVVYLTTLSETGTTTKRRMTRMSSKLERHCRRSDCTIGTEENYETQNFRSPGRDLNPGPAEYETGVLTTRPWHSRNPSWKANSCITDVSLMKPEGALPCSQGPATGVYTKPHHANPVTSYFINTYFNTTLPSTPRFCKCPLPFRFTA